MPSDKYEKECWRDGKFLAGFDESGYGCIGLHLTVAGAIFEKGFVFADLPGLNDSKKLTESQRFSLEAQIKDKAFWWFCKSATAAEVDAAKTGTDNVYWLRFRMIEDHIKENRAAMPKNFVSLMDGNKALRLDTDSRCLVKGDALCYSIAAASILAKCEKDRLAYEVDKEYPMYGFAEHKGYYNAAHVKAIEKYGFSPHHRRTYCRNITPGTGV